MCVCVYMYVLPNVWYALVKASCPFAKTCHVEFEQEILLLSPLFSCHMKMAAALVKPWWLKCCITLLHIWVFVLFWTILWPSHKPKKRQPPTVFALNKLNTLQCNCKSTTRIPFSMLVKTFFCLQISGIWWPWKIFGKICELFICLFHFD